jgi:ATP-binding cassette, subfamily B, bacterial
MTRRRDAQVAANRARGASLLRALSIVSTADRRSFLAVVCLFAASGLGVAGLVLIGNVLLHELIAGGAGSQVSAQVWWLVAAAIAVAGAVSFAGAAGAGLHRLLAERTIRYCHEVVLRLTSQVQLREFDSPAFHDRLERARNGTQSALPIAMAVPELFGAIVGCLGLTVGLAVVNPWLVPITLVASLPLWLAGKSNSEQMYSFSFGNTPNDRARFHIERITNDRQSAAEVRAFRLASFLFGRWSTLYDERIDGIAALVRRFIRRSAVGSLVGSIVLGAVILMVLYFVRRGDLTLGSAATACVAVLLLANRSQQAASRLAQTMEHGLHVAEFVELRDWADRIRTEPPAMVEPLTRMTVEDASFSYPSAPGPALDRLTFEIAAGEVIAIVGHNGSGKTTLAKLLCGLYAPTSGAICWNGRSVAELAGGGGLSRIGVVFQDFGRYWFSAADNVAIGDIERSSDRSAIEDSAREAGAGEFLAQLPDGFDTPLGVELEGGADLSVGQWQRVAIARVLFRKASFIVLDEPTASLDAEAEAALFQTIQELRHGRTIILISHRFSTVRSADRILVLDHGRLVEQGPHEELMALDGHYARMYRLQASAYADA